MLKSYEPDGMGTHTVKIKFVCETAYCEIVTEIDGNTAGTQILESFMADDFISAPQNHEGNKKYARFFAEDAGKEYGEIQQFVFHYPNGGILLIDAEEDSDINRYMIGVEIIGYKPEE